MVRVRVGVLRFARAAHDRGQEYRGWAENTCRVLQFLRHSLDLARSPAFHALFMPTYFDFGGWPAHVRLAVQIAAIACAVAWIMPGLRTETKAASFTLLGSLLYLSYFPPAPCPWYLCLPALFGFLTLSGLLAQVLSVAQKIAFPTARGLLGFLWSWCR